ncbi:conserved hypothetical protein [Ricinus communis]|uniref:Uncharacterized protein n=1 Tax=Ricinus communis TaxID=3988 RepID=B9RG68_RICCO|nr:conserved hypothetical protein [Ricinus communis]
MQCCARRILELKGKEGEVPVGLTRKTQYESTRGIPTPGGSMWMCISKYIDILYNPELVAKNHLPRSDNEIEIGNEMVPHAVVFKPINKSLIWTSYVKKRQHALQLQDHESLSWTKQKIGDQC